MLSNAIAHPRFADVFAEIERDERTDCHERRDRSDGEESVTARPIVAVAGGAVTGAVSVDGDWLDVLTIVTGTAGFMVNRRDIVDAGWLQPWYN